jgi:hypothetical protein
MTVPKGLYCQNKKGKPCNHLNLKYPPSCSKYSPLCISGKRKPVLIEVRYIKPEKIIRALKCSLCLRNSGGRETKIKGIKRRA